MQPEFLKLLCCPACPGSGLHLENATTQNNRIHAGQLRCSHCQNAYPIIQGIPRFVSVEGLQQSDAQSVQGDIAQNFGDAWQIYAEKRRNPYTEEQFLEWIQPLTPSDFEGKCVLDLGSGLSGFTEYGAQYGARQVIGLEISHAIDAAAPLLAEYPNLNLVQGNILQPPFQPAAFDLIYSIGVLHHLEEPSQGFRATVPLMKPDGRFFMWLYGRENNGLVVHVIDPLRKLASRLPVRWVRYGLALPMSVPLYALLHTVYHPALQPVFGKLPYYDYFQWLRKYGFRYVLGMVTDQLVPPRTHYLSRPQLTQWIERAALVLESITPRNNISWRVLCKKPPR
jgi:uncharacterized protein YbaR (Trm112 family)/SAM-dependent methyltransferase